MKKIGTIIIVIFLALISFVSALGLRPKINATLKAEGDNYNCNAYCLIDYASGEVLTSRNEEAHYEIASMVKLMTSLLVLERLDSGALNLSDKVMVSEYAASQEGSQAFLDAHQEYTIEDLLKSVIVASANDSSVVLAEAIAGSEHNFVGLMNDKARELELNNTLYANSTGLPAINQYSCAIDTAKLLKEVSKHDTYKKFSTIWMDKLVHPSGRVTELVNTNRLIKYYPSCDCGKTGFTDEAGYCLSASASQNGLRLIAVTMGAKTANDRFTITSSLLNYGFANFTNKVEYTTQDSIKYNKEQKALKRKF